MGLLSFLFGCGGESKSLFQQKDGAWYYHCGALLTKEASSFKMLAYGYARTATQVYHSGKPVSGADPASFATLERPSETADAQDRNATYQQGRRVTMQ